MIFLLASRSSESLRKKKENMIIIFNGFYPSSKFPFISLNLPLVVVDNDKIIPSQHGGLADN